jgi:hypothetical protein
VGCFVPPRFGTHLFAMDDARGGELVRGGQSARRRLAPSARSQAGFMHPVSL